MNLFAKALCLGLMQGEYVFCQRIRFMVDAGGVMGLGLILVYF
jgi:hypothetical protein